MRIVVYLGTLVGLGVERITDTDRLGLLDTARDKLVVDVLLDKDARAGAAALALVEEEAERRLIDRVLQIVALEIAEDDVGRLAAELESNSL